MSVRAPTEAAPPSIGASYRPVSARNTFAGRAFGKSDAES